MTPRRAARDMDLATLRAVLRPRPWRVARLTIDTILYSVAVCAIGVFIALALVTLATLAH